MFHHHTEFVQARQVFYQFSDITSLSFVLSYLFVWFVVDVVVNFRWGVGGRLLINLPSLELTL